MHPVLASYITLNWSKLLKTSTSLISILITLVHNLLIQHWSPMADMQDFAIPFVIFLASIFLVQTISAKIGGKAGLPPSPRALPIIGHMYLLGPIPHQAFHKLSTRYGPLVYFFTGSKPCLLASTREVAKEFLKINEANFLNRHKVSVVCGPAPCDGGTTTLIKKRGSWLPL